MAWRSPSSKLTLWRRSDGVQFSPLKAVDGSSWGSNSFRNKLRFFVLILTTAIGMVAPVGPEAERRRKFLKLPRKNPSYRRPEATGVKACANQPKPQVKEVEIIFGSQDNHGDCEVDNPSLNRSIVVRQQKPNEIKTKTCHICGASFASPHERIKHLISHPETTTHPCHICNRVFLNQGSLQRHFLVHADRNQPSFVKNYSCPRCDRMFAYRSNFIHHFRLHTGDKPLFCLDCNRTFTQTASLQMHRQAAHATGEPALSCEFPNCERRFYSSSNMKRHMQIHLKEYVCNLCPKNQSKFLNSSMLKDHVLLVHERLQVGFKVTKNAEGKLGYQCPKCWKFFSKFQNLRTHFRRHTGIRPYLCPEPGCEERFIQRTSLNIHIARAHMDKLPFSCSNCSKGFSLKSNLLLHEATHLETSARKAFTCLNCSASFTLRRNLLTHYNVCRNLRPFRCPYQGCDRKYREKRLLKSHVQRHEQIKLYRCKICEENFIDIAGRNEHLMRKHPFAFRCAVCDFASHSPRSLSIHINGRHSVAVVAQAVEAYRLRNKTESIAKQNTGFSTERQSLEVALQCVQSPKSFKLPDEFSTTNAKQSTSSLKKYLRCQPWHGFI